MLTLDPAILISDELRSSTIERMMSELVSSPTTKIVNSLRSASLVNNSAISEELGQIMTSAVAANVIFQTKSVSVGLCEPTYLMRYNVGDFVKPHFDNGSLLEDRLDISHPERMLTSIIFLNSNFEGGEIEFNSLGKRIKPIAGMMLTFPSDIRYVYSINPVTAGERYSAICWHTVRA